MATVRMIPARPAVGARKKTENAPKIRVAAYCRVSTDTDEQATSYDAQIEHYTDLIAKHPEWELAGIYADDGISVLQFLITFHKGSITDTFLRFDASDEEIGSDMDMLIACQLSHYRLHIVECIARTVHHLESDSTLLPCSQCAIRKDVGAGTGSTVFFCILSRPSAFSRRLRSFLSAC